MDGRRAVSDPSSRGCEMIDTSRFSKPQPRVAKTPEWFAALSKDDQAALLLLRRQFTEGKALWSPRAAWHDVNEQLGAQVCSEGTWRSFLAGKSVIEPEATRAKSKARRR